MNLVIGNVRVDSYSEPIQGLYFYKNTKGWVKRGQSDNVVQRFAQHRTSLGVWPNAIIMTPATYIDDLALRQRIRPWIVPGTVEWYYDVEPMWVEVKRYAKEQDCIFIKLNFEPYLPLFDEPPV